jgi:hypothetical protein
MFGTKAHAGDRENFEPKGSLTPTLSRRDTPREREASEASG